MKKCQKCLLLLSDDNFYKGKNKDGLTSYCKSCFKSSQKYRPDYYREWSKKNKDKLKEYYKKYYQKNKDKYKSRENSAYIKAYRSSEEYKKWKNQYAKNQYIKHINKYKARRKMKYLIESKKIKRLPCQICGNLKTEFHHIDYSLPYSVYHLCDTHHKEAHLNPSILNNIIIYDYSGFNIKTRR